MRFDNVFLVDSYVIGCKLEKDGPIGPYLDKTYDDNELGCKTWEKAEMRLLDEAISNVMEEDIDYIVSGDLINQNVISNYTVRKYDIPFVGIYGACSNLVLGLLISSIFIENKLGKKIMTSTSSHYGASEKQFRNPTEYGGSKPNSVTSTVSGSCAVLLGNKENSMKLDIRISEGTFGKVIDSKLNNPLDLGVAMAPAAANTVLEHFKKYGSDSYDLVLTGDLSKNGKKVFLDIIRNNGFNIDDRYEDCGLLIYDIESQKVFAGGSGCACCGLVTFSYIKELLLRKTLNKVLLVATGALLNNSILYQKETIPSIAHAVTLEVVN